MEKNNFPLFFYLTYRFFPPFIKGNLCISFNFLLFLPFISVHWKIILLFNKLPFYCSLLSDLSLSKASLNQDTWVWSNWAWNEYKGVGAKTSKHNYLFNPLVRLGYNSQVPIDTWFLIEYQVCSVVKVGIYGKFNYVFYIYTLFFKAFKLCFFSRFLHQFFYTL